MSHFDNHFMVRVAFALSHDFLRVIAAELAVEEAKDGLVFTATAKAALIDQACVELEGNDGDVLLGIVGGRSPQRRARLVVLALLSGYLRWIIWAAWAIPMRISRS